MEEQEDEDEITDKDWYTADAAAEGVDGSRGRINSSNDCCSCCCCCASLLSVCWSIAVGVCKESATVYCCSKESLIPRQSTPEKPSLKGEGEQEGNKVKGSSSNIEGNKEAEAEDTDEETEEESQTAEEGGE